MEIRAAVLHRVHEPVPIEAIEVDKPSGREVLVRTVATGVCHRDLHVVDGASRYDVGRPIALGHDGASASRSGKGPQRRRPADHRGRHVRFRARYGPTRGRHPHRERREGVQTSRMGSNRFRLDIPRYLDFYRQGRRPLDEMVRRRGHIDDLNEAFRAKKAGEVARTGLTFD